MPAPALPVSILDLAPVTEGSTPRDTFRRTVELAQLAERVGYRRFWLAEHHNMPGIASAATAVLIGHVAGATQSIRVGAGGVMLPNHAPLQVAEQFGTLDALYPERIDLGLGRAPGTDQAAARALRRYYQSAEEFPADVVELLGYFAPVGGGPAVQAQAGQAGQQGQGQQGQQGQQGLAGLAANAVPAVQAVPGAGADVEVWILGSSLFGARLAAALGLPYAFASHFAPDALEEALAVYRGTFRPSARLAAPHVMLALNVVVADTDAEAARLFTTQQQAFVRLRRGQPGLVPPPLPSAEAFADFASPVERAGVDRALACAVVGAPDTVRAGIAAFVARYRPDELIVTANIFDHAARLRSFEAAHGLVG